MSAAKPTTDLRQAWTLGALVVGVTAFFIFIILPYLGPRRPASRERAPDFALPVLGAQGDDGSRIRLSDLRGAPVVLDFWASWCAPCKAQMPILDRLARRTPPAEGRFIGINTADDAAGARALLAELAPAYPSLLDETGNVARGYGADRLPTLVVLDAEGEVHMVHHGVLSEERVEALLVGARK